jgi:3-ketoacyl-CoA synthase
MFTGNPAAQKFSQESLEFQRRISQRNGLSEETYLPPALHTLPPVVTMETAREEARMVLFGAVQDVLDRTGEPISCHALHNPRGFA